MVISNTLHWVGFIEHHMVNAFATTLIAWQRTAGRHHLPWQQQRTAYSVWVSEIMLQQTQVTTVIDYYTRFMNRFPTVKHLANADEEVVFQLWAGLGYYQRARNLHRTSQIVVAQYDSVFPIDPEILITLPGIGKSTAHAICSLVANLPYAILDANAKRVIMRYHNLLDDPNQSAVKKRLWELAQSMMPHHDCATYTQAIMDLGAQHCKKNPLCADCPVRPGCQSYQANTMHLIPPRRPRKKKPERSAYFIWYRYKEQTLFIKRPPTGIWSNLWVPIETDTLASHPGTVTRSLTPKTHTFTHFILHMHPVIIELPEKISYPGGSWFHTDEMMKLALPAPIKALITSDDWQ